MALTILVSILADLALIEGGIQVERLPFLKANYTHLSNFTSALAKAHYNAWTCNYKAEPGYRCLSCTEALHCYPIDIALLVQCAGLFPYCRNGYCSMFKQDECNEQYMFAEGTHGPLRVTTPSNEKTTMSPDTALSETTEQISDENTTNIVTTAMTPDSNRGEEIFTSTATVDSDFFI